MATSQHLSPWEAEISELLCLWGISKAQGKRIPPPMLSPTSSDVCFYCRPMNGNEILGCAFAKPVTFTKLK